MFAPKTLVEQRIDEFKEMRDELGSKASDKGSDTAIQIDMMDTKPENLMSSPAM